MGKKEVKSAFTEEGRQVEWRHPGGKLRDWGPKSLTNQELLAILISTGIPGKTAEDIAKEILDKFGSFKGMANQPLEKFLQFKGMGDVKIIRIAAAFEIARRITGEVLEKYEEQKTQNSGKSHTNIKPL